MSPRGFTRCGFSLCPGMCRLLAATMIACHFAKGQLSGYLMVTVGLCTPLKLCLLLFQDHGKFLRVPESCQVSDRHRFLRQRLHRPGLRGHDKVTLLPMVRALLHAGEKLKTLRVSGVLRTQALFLTPTLLGVSKGKQLVFHTDYIWDPILLGMGCARYPSCRLP